MPDWNYIHIELRKKAVTLQLLWIEYREQFPEGLGYSQFCNLYSAWRKKVDVVMRQHHRAGEKMFVDFPGMTIPIYDRTSQCGGPTHSISCNCGDPSQQVWWFEWLPWALTHGHNPMLTNAIWARLGGVNALSRSATALIGDCGFVFVFSAIMRAHSAKCRSSRRVRPGLGVAAIREYTSFASRDSGCGALQVWISSKSGPVRRSRGAVAGSPPSIPSRAIR